MYPLWCHKGKLLPILLHYFFIPFQTRGRNSEEVALVGQSKLFFFQGSCKQGAKCLPQIYRQCFNECFKAHPLKSREKKKTEIWKFTFVILIFLLGNTKSIKSREKYVRRRWRWWWRWWWRSESCNLGWKTVQFCWVGIWQGTVACYWLGLVYITGLAAPWLISFAFLIQFGESLKLNSKSC